MLPTDPPGPISELRRLEILNRVGAAMAGNLALDDIVQVVTDAATALTGAQFAAFFYNVLDDRGERYLLYALSGAPRSAFEQLGMPRNTAVFDHTFRGLGVVRSDDITADPRYGQMAPHHGMPPRHLPVTSYLAVPVKSQSGEILGGLLLGHPNRAIFGPAHETTVIDLAARAAVAIDNARLLDAAQRLASIVESSDDAIISKDLTGIIKSWNRGAERVFGYNAAEIIGKPMTTLIPADLQHEEPEILRRIINGERIDHYETLRQRKDGRIFHVSVTVSPIRDRSGKIIGASKIGRDIDLSKKAQEQQSLLLREMHHRAKNLFAVASGVVALSARSAGNPGDMAQAIQSRLAALARAHDLTMPQEGDVVAKTSLRDLAGTILSPYDTAADRIDIRGDAVECGANVATSFALLLHEFATNSVKYGALSVAAGGVRLHWQTGGDVLEMIWTEQGGPLVVAPSGREGFGGTLVTATAKSLGAVVEREWRPQGLRIRLVIPVAAIAA